VRFRNAKGKYCRAPKVGAVDLTGKRFGRLFVERSAGFVRRGKLQNSLRVWKCKCLPKFGGCGGVNFQATNSLNGGNVNSCGCLNREHRVKIGKANRKHGQCCHVDGKQQLSPTWISWRSMHERCENQNPNAKTYLHYFAKGIRVCRRWSGKHGFENFFKDRGTRPVGTTLDRKDSNKNYTPKNTRWSSPKVQNHNRAMSNHEIVLKAWVTRRNKAERA
jgi:hypothetical protein